jgi:lysozyme
VAVAFSDIQVILLAVLALAQLIVFGLLQWRALGLAARPTDGPYRPPQPVPVPLPIPAPRPASAPPAAVPAPSTPPPVVDQDLVDFVKKQEGYSAKAYWDYKQYTIGYGTKANSATEQIDEAEAMRRVTVEINAAWQLVKKIIPAGTPVGIEQALTDLTYNAGSGWEEQSLGAAVKAAKWDTVKADILQYNHAGGQVLPALTKRREAEVSWFDTPL